RVGAEVDAERALEFARLTGHPYDVLPALAFGARVALGRGGGRSQALIEELLDCASEDWFWAAWALADAALAATALGRAGDLATVLSRAPFPTTWTRAALAHARGDLGAA